MTSVSNFSNLVVASQQHEYTYSTTGVSFRGQMGLFAYPPWLWFALLGNFILTVNQSS